MKPNRLIGGKLRAFNAKWLNDFPWLRYSVSMDLLEAVREAGVVVDILRAERMDETVFDAIFQKEADIASEFQIDASVPRQNQRQRNRANYQVEDPKTYWRIALYNVFVDHLIEEVSSRVVYGFWGASPPRPPDKGATAPLIPNRALSSKTAGYAPGDWPVVVSTVSEINVATAAADVVVASGVVVECVVVVVVVVVDADVLAASVVVFCCACDDVGVAAAVTSDDVAAVDIIA
ncbi:hypothetical protein MAR_022409 [Mya arenaria]|uniref:Uncharacterized protein n=1 Tax=Mya arenaria TaxID=6604 RepID=A0ABY7DM54_MYAAR|nr:hypothetical protein MAR_022409 [Mya arenaria]